MMVGRKMGIRYKKSVKWKNTGLKEDQFMYLGLIIIQDNGIKTEISMTLQSANKCFYGLGKLF